MKWSYTLALSVLFIVFTYAQSDSPVIKRYAKVHQDKKYIITEYVYPDGHLENYITSVPVSQLRKLNAQDPLLKASKNIYWDENTDKEGFQVKMNSTVGIQKAFNNALAETEAQLNLDKGTLGSIHLDADFLSYSTEKQSFVLINEVINAISKSKEFSSLIPLEAVDKNISKDSKKLAQNLMTTGTSNKNTSAEKIGYRNIEFSEHVKNDGVFLSNGEDEIAIPHIQAIYNWMFADEYTGWYNRKLLINRNSKNGSNGLKDDFQLKGIEGFMGIGIATGQFMDVIIDNPTFEKATSVVFQLVDPIEGSRYGYQIIETEDTRSAIIVAE
ncbi:hypothetical protein [Portibacter lacus]|uniref:Uncharacterized protein n=1 Tax=Portibacter lacus TaxID=1099794 RepID=A0AA37WI22_9BACT|nr:hypothetical protein [Portibacter lacus]GLR19200.1 hypothetical protein GCM10007940_38160 [Portibacter lacus]